MSSTITKAGFYLVREAVDHEWTGLEVVDVDGLGTLYTVGDDTQLTWFQVRGPVDPAMVPPMGAEIMHGSHIATALRRIARDLAVSLEDPYDVPWQLDEAARQMESLHQSLWKVWNMLGAKGEEQAVSVLEALMEQARAWRQR